MVYIKSLVQCAKHRNQSINISCSCHEYVYFTGVSVCICTHTYGSQSSTLGIFLASCTTAFYKSPSRGWGGATEFFIPSFCSLEAPGPPPQIPPPGHCLPSPSPSPRSLRKEGQGRTMAIMGGCPGAKEMTAASSKRLFQEQWKPRG